jgi:hypothetical protein
MRRWKADEGLDFEALRHAIEHCDLDVMLGFYAEDVKLSIVNVEAPRSFSFELRGKGEIAKYLRAVFGPETSHLIEQEIIHEGWVTFREAYEYPDGSRIMVETKLEVHSGKIVRQVDVVAMDSQADRKEEIGQRPPT